MAQPIRYRVQRRPVQIQNQPRHTCTHMPPDVRSAEISSENLALQLHNCTADREPGMHEVRSLRPRGGPMAQAFQQDCKSSFLPFTQLFLQTGEHGALCHVLVLRAAVLLGLSNALHNSNGETGGSRQPGHNPTQRCDQSNNALRGDLGF